MTCLHADVSAELTASQMEVMQKDERLKKVEKIENVLTKTQEENGKLKMAALKKAAELKASQTEVIQKDERLKKVPACPPKQTELPFNVTGGAI